MSKGEEIKVRVLPAMKEEVKKIADQRITSESEIVREAILEYLHRARKKPAPETSSTALSLKEGNAPAPKSGIHRKVRDIVQKRLRAAPVQSPKSDA